MIRRCNGADPNLRTEGGAVGNCGRTFDDVNHLTICPHDEFPINSTVRAQLQYAADASGLNVPDLLAAVSSATGLSVSELLADGGPTA